MVASNVAFDTASISLPAGVASTISFDNQDAGIQHNVSLFVDEAMTHSVFMGEIVIGPATIDYELDPLQPGTYYFRCDVHPTTMMGTVTVA